MSNTRKKVKVVGKESYINQSTGEINEMQVIEIEERDANFHKLWLGHILNSIDLIGNQKTKLAFWVLDNLDSNNLLTMTQRQIADKSGISYQTVSRTLKALIDSNFLQCVNQGVYRVNPDVLFKGGKNARMNTPSTLSDKNWSWRCLPGVYNDTLADVLHHEMKLYGRI